MGNKLGKRQIILVTMAFVMLVVASIYLFVIDGDWLLSDGYSSGNTETVEQFVPAPREATLEEYRQATEDDSLIDANSRGEIEELYHRRIVAKLEAEISSYESQKNVSEIERQRAAAEIDEVRARIERENRMAAIQEREANRDRTITGTQGTINIDDADNAARIAALAAIDAQIERDLKKTTPRPERSARLHQAKADYAVVSIDGVMHRLSVGESVGGVRLVSTNEKKGSAVLHGNASGERVTVNLGSNTSRRLANIKPLIGDTNDADINGVYEDD